MNKKILDKFAEKIDKDHESIEKIKKEMREQKGNGDGTELQAIKDDISSLRQTYMEDMKEVFKELQMILNMILKLKWI